MQPIPNDNLLTIIVILVGAISISQFFPYRKEPLYSTFNINRITNILITLIIAFLIVISFNLAPIHIDLIDDVLVGLSALLAFAAVVKSIQHSNNVEEKRKKDEQRSSKSRLSVYLNGILETFEILKFLEDKNHKAYDDILIKLNDIKATIEKDSLVFEHVKIEDMIGLLSSLRHNKTESSENLSAESLKAYTEASEKLILSLQYRLTMLVKHIAEYNNIELYVKEKVE